MIFRLLISLVLLSAAYSSPAQDTLFSKRSHFNSGRGYHPFKYATSNSIEIHNITDTIISDIINLHDTLTDFSITFRATNLSCHPSKRFSYTDRKGTKRLRSNPEWSFLLTSNESDTLTFTVKSEEIPDPISSSSAIRFTVHDSKSNKIVASQILNDGIDCHNGKNVWSLSVSPRSFSISAGNHALLPALDIPYSGKAFTQFGFSASPAAHVSISDISITDKTPDAKKRHVVFQEPEKLKERLENPQDTIEGYWTLFDRNLEESLLQMGGDYRLAIIRDKERYLILYLSGAKTNAATWTPGMIKGILNPDPFPETYSVIWYDTEGNPLSKGVKAQLGEGSTLLIQFPYQSSTLRLRKIP